MLNFPSTRKQEGDKIRADIQSSLPSSNPYDQNNYLWAFATALGNRIFDVYRNLSELLNLWFIKTSSGKSLLKRASTWGLTLNPATQASGNINITGVVGSIMTVGTQLKNANGDLYDTLTAVTISEQTINISSLVSSGTTATATTADSHNLATGMTIVVAGATETEYNGSYVITVTSNTTFTYVFAGSGTTPATGTITATGDFATVGIESIEYGADLNLESGEQLTLLSPISGIDNTAYVLFDGVGGGADIETEAELKERLLFRIQNPVANFNDSAIINEAKKVSFVNRVWVFEITPNVGDVTIYFDKKGDDIIPNGTEVAEVKTQILTIKPAPSSDDDVYVIAPTLKPINFTFSSITPDNTGLRTAIDAELDNFFKTQVTLGEDIPSEAYISTIWGARDLTTGNGLTDFTLTTPTGDITVATGEIPSLGTVTFT